MNTKRCPCCRGADLSVFFERDNAPVLCNQLWPDADGARAAPRGRIELGFCESCGMIHNVAFDPALMDYGQAYENSLHFSPRFQQYAESLAADLVRKYDLRGKDIVEIGSGKGEFLKIICEHGGSRGVGFDTSYEGPTLENDESSSVRFVRDFYSSRYGSLPADLICCRHVLEHIADPLDFLERIRSVTGEQRDAAIFFEVPNALYTLRDLGIWDIIYEHCSYFCAPSLERLFSAVGFEPREVYDAFGGQFLCIEAGSGPAASRPAARGLDELPGLVRDFERHFREKVDLWNGNLVRLIEQRKKVAVWGAGSKGVMFLNTLDAGGYISCVIDLNSRKHGRYVPLTGQEVVAPENIKDSEIDTVLIMNPLYEGEIRDSLRRMGSAAETAVV